jgi:hypothetical protein
MLCFLTLNEHASKRQSTSGARSLARFGSARAKPHHHLPSGVLSSVSLPQEREQLVALSLADRSVCWDRLLFSCKESVFKAWYPLTHRELDFEEASIVIEPTGHIFSARLLPAGPLVHGRRLQRLDGRWIVHDGLVLTAIAVLAASRLVRSTIRVRLPEP